ncbi:MAG: acyl carrier protein [Candidatus Sungbacteria bacterium]|nr:acyl carrier protein [Candidatus Sungbacteria bacterium]
MRTFNNIVAEVFKISDAEIHDGLSSKDIPEWDSMNYLLFVAELEKEFDLSFSMDEVMTTQCLGDIRGIIEARGKKHG